MPKTSNTLETVINAAGKLTALGGSAQSEAVAGAQAIAASKHVDLAQFRRRAGQKVAQLTGADAACITSGAAAGIAIAIAAILTRGDLDKTRQLPQFDGKRTILLQAGHDIDFGATVEQMIRLGGGNPSIVGSREAVTPDDLERALSGSPAAFVFVQSHHCIQENRVPLTDCIAACSNHDVPVLVDAAAEEDLGRYIDAGADLVTYSGGKAFGGPTIGFIAGSSDLIEACEQQFRGIARSMKVGKEAIAGFLVALDEYTSANPSTRYDDFDARNKKLIDGIRKDNCFEISLKPDEAGRPFSRVAIAAREDSFDIRQLVRYLADGSPSIRTRNHHLASGIVLIDPRELTTEDVDTIIDRLNTFAGARS
jgi:L-seryl-tRNA(Ser) seleniumtransferase/D-glucosaminate-6-phosphate ammonia-lyase